MCAPQVPAAAASATFTIRRHAKRGARWPPSGRRSKRAPGWSAWPPQHPGKSASGLCMSRGCGAPRRAKPRRSGGFLSAPGEIRTPDLRFRRPTLYPAELRALWGLAVRRRGPVLSQRHRIPHQGSSAYPSAVGPGRSPSAPHWSSPDGRRPNSPAQSRRGCVEGPTVSASHVTNGRAASSSDRTSSSQRRLCNQGLSGCLRDSVMRFSRR